MTDNKYRIGLDKEWTLQDLYEFPRNFLQVYAMLYPLYIPFEEGDIRREGIKSIFTSYPWRGGYSAVGFYNNLQKLIPPQDRPELISIHYGSPGLIELGLVVGVAVGIGKLVNVFTNSANSINSSYHNIRKGMYDRELMQLDVKQKEFALKEDELKFIEHSIDVLSKEIKFEKTQELYELTDKNELAELKILLSLCRRVDKLAAYEKDGKTCFRDE